ncbi:putative disease resistance RPP13-like protein 1 [Populus alba]|uniref:putative disease resistance RPP13-like protein 1 n=1 Tax=Populus alba TaxID=43335 RepID=UPI00158D4890|nr:putative disease resistance protein At3g14460 [Populus alba]XP_034921646.1 putative disease resistance protein At3g14460 [Populus alba]XP_034921647.1 putative disease resistance protein At3g14460 [Populus alba]
MAAALVGGAFLSASLQVLFDRMASRQVVDFFKSQKLNDRLLKKLKILMITVNKVLNDAEKKQISDSFVKEWLVELKDAVYEAEDFLDGVAYEGLRLEVEAGSQTSTDQVRGFLSSRNTVQEEKEEMGAKLEEILELLEYLVQQKDALGLKEGFGEQPLSYKIPTTSLVDGSGVFGRHDDKEAIMKLMLSEDAKLDVIPIVGMGGVGKTTLAQLIYNDSRVQERFDLKVWVSVSEESDVFKLIKDMLLEIGSLNCDTMTADQLHKEVEKRTAGKTVLIVLDDVWSENQDQWDSLLTPLKSVRQGSKIIVTTRNDSVASVKSTVPTHHLQKLTEDDCWLVFAKQAFDDGSSGACPDLEQIGRGIVRKCNGLPLAAKALGGLLRSKRDAKDWEKVLKSDMWTLPKDPILPALRLSYYYLPAPLKQCFAYCALFPKDYRFNKDDLVRLWMAEGFLVPLKGDEEFEDVGGEFFDDLVSRSFFQRYSSDNLSLFIMHDLINDLAKSVTGEFCFLLEDDDSNKIAAKARHFSYVPKSFDSLKKFVGIYGAEHLRTFLPLAKQWEDYRSEDGLTRDLLPSLRRLRVLSLSRYSSVAELSNSMGKLKHLRYLNLWGTSIEEFPEVVSTAYNLQTLILEDCKRVAELPNSIGNLKQLRHVNLTKTAIERLPASMSGLYNLRTLILKQCKKLTELPADMARLINLQNLDILGTKLSKMPSQMDRLTKLQTLSDFFLGRQGGSSIIELGKLQHLQGGVTIWGLQNVVNAQDALEANLKGMKQVKALELRWDGDADDSQHQRDVLDKLQPHTGVTSLYVGGYGGTRFPDWIADISFSNIVVLDLFKCAYCTSLPPLGQLGSLKELCIQEFEGVVVVGHEFYGSCTSLKEPFGSLEILTFASMPQWNEWISDEDMEAFPLLRELHISGCPSLTKALPNHHLPSLTELNILDCQQLGGPFPWYPIINRFWLNDASRDLRLEKLPSELYELEIRRLDSIDSLVKELELMGCLSSMFENIEIDHFDLLKCFPLELFSNLQTLKIKNCPNLNSLSAYEKPYNRSLRFLEIQGCPNLVCFPKGGLSAPNLTKIRLLDCINLKALPEQMSFLFSLVDLKLKGLPELESFPEGGLPLDLETLCIQSCNKLIASRAQWDLLLQCSLSKLIIAYNEDVESFPDGLLLPSELRSLEIRSLENLKSLDYNGLLHLTCLRELKIDTCPNLQSIPERGLPSSLYSFEISGCPQLEKRCEKEKGEDWPKISHLLYIKIDGRWIEPEDW